MKKYKIKYGVTKTFVDENGYFLGDKFVVDVKQLHWLEERLVDRVLKTGKEPKC